MLRPPYFRDRNRRPLKRSKVVPRSRAGLLGVRIIFILDGNRKPGYGAQSFVAVATEETKQ